MRIEVDQSGKVENTQTDTILAFSNGNQKSIILPAKLKRKWFILMARRRKTKKVTYLLLFSVCLFLLLKDAVNINSQIYIDREYIGHERDIKAMLLRFFAKLKKKINTDQIHFTNIGKQSKAHLLALRVFRERAKADKTISDKELFSFF